VEKELQKRGDFKVIVLGFKLFFWSQVFVRDVGERVLQYSQKEVV
jgi:hypothetical protein